MYFVLNHRRDSSPLITNNSRTQMPPTNTPSRKRASTSNPAKAAPTEPASNVLSARPSTPTSAAIPTRLGSLSRRPTPGGNSVTSSPSSASGTPKRAFTPKLVGRRSKETRDKSAPTASKITPHVVSPSVPLRGDRNGNRGRGGMSRRGRGRFEPIATQAVGAFSAIGSFESHRQTPLAVEIRGDPDISHALSNAPKGEQDDDFTSDPNAFNMTRNAGVDVDDFFPVRPVRLDQKVEDGVIKVEENEESSTAKRSLQLPNAYITAEEQIEHQRAAKDHETIAHEFNISSIVNNTTTPIPDAEVRPEIEQKLFFFQMPVLGPKFETDKESQANQRPIKYPEGMAGKLRLHKSGKLTMLLGNIVMEVSQGTEASFLQDVVSLNPENQEAFLIGQVTRKMIVSPDVDELLRE